jgi:hypothetical protein
VSAPEPIPVIDRRIQAKSASHYSPVRHEIIHKRSAWRPDTVSNYEPPKNLSFGRTEASSRFGGYDPN